MDTVIEERRTAAKSLADFARVVAREHRKLYQQLQQLGSPPGEDTVQAYGRVSGLVREIQRTAIAFWLRHGKPEEVESWLEREVLDLLDDDFLRYTAPEETVITEEGITPKK